MVWVSLKDNNKWSKYIWIPRSKDYLIDAREFLKAQVTIDHPNKIPDEDFVASSYARQALTKIGLGYPTKGSAANWYNISRASYETTRVVEGNIDEAPNKNSRYAVLAGAFQKPNKKKQPKKPLSDLLSPAGDRLKKMATYNKR